MLRRQITSPSLDENGNGYLDVGVPFDKFVTLLPFGPSPDRDGYSWPNWYWAVSDFEGKTRVEIEGATPHGTVKFVVWAVE